MNPSRLFILRPVATSLLMLAILLVGILAYRYLPLSALPEVDYPTIQITTLYPGASPEVVTSSVTAPLEQKLGQMPGLNQMSSTSSAGASVVTLQFSLDLSLDVAEQEVQAAINAAGTFLPTANLPSPPIYSKVNPADAPILTLALTSKTLPLTQLEDMADTRLAQKISQIDGVGLVTLSGGQRPAVRVQANPTALAAYGMSLEDLRNAISSANVNSSKGSFDGPTRSYTIDANDQLKSADAYRDIVIAFKNGAPVHLVRCRHDRRWRGEQQTRRVGQHHARHHHEHPAPAGRERHRRRRFDQAATAATRTVDAGIGRHLTAHRPHRDRARIGRGCRIRTVPRRRARRRGDFRVPAQSAGDDHSEFLGATLTGRHLRRDVPVRLQPQQSHHDGADHLDRLRRRRCHRDDREHFALSRRRRKAARRRTERRRTDRLHHRLADHLADRRADPVAVHGRRGRAPVPPVRGHARRHHRHFRRRLADARADVVRENPQAPQTRRRKPFPALDGRASSTRSSKTTAAG